MIHNEPMTKTRKGRKYPPLLMPTPKWLLWHALGGAILWIMAPYIFGSMTAGDYRIKDPSAEAILWFVIGGALMGMIGGGMLAVHLHHIIRGLRWRILFEIIAVWMAAMGMGFLCGYLFSEETDGVFRFYDAILMMITLTMELACVFMLVRVHGQTDAESPVGLILLTVAATLVLFFRPLQLFMMAGLAVVIGPVIFVSAKFQSEIIVSASVGATFGIFCGLIMHAWICYSFTNPWRREQRSLFSNLKR